MGGLSEGNAGPTWEVPDKVTRGGGLPICMVEWFCSLKQGYGPSLELQSFARVLSPKTLLSLLALPSVYKATRVSNALHQELDHPLRTGFAMQLLLV